jgi:hypothetical protein
MSTVSVPGLPGTPRDAETIPTSDPSRTTLPGPALPPTSATPPHAVVDEPMALRSRYHRGLYIGLAIGLAIGLVVGFSL